MDDYDLKIHAIQGLDEMLNAIVQSFGDFSSIKTPGLRACTIRYRVNLDRLRSLSRLPFDISRHSRFGHHTNWISWLRHGFPEIRRREETEKQTKSGLPSSLLQRDKEIEEEVRKRLDALDNSDPPLPPDDFRAAVIENQERGDYRIAEIWLGSIVAEQLFRPLSMKGDTPEEEQRALNWSIMGTQDIYKNDSGIRQALQAWVESLFVSAWSVLEDMAGTLWESAVNVHPTGLALLKGTAHASQDDGSQTNQKKDGDEVERTDEDEDESETDDKAGRSIKISDLQRHGWDVRKEMGTLLRTSRVVTFQTLSDIIESYERTFWEHRSNIMSSLRDVAINELSIVRNAIVHGAGRCDEAYKRRTKGKSCPHLPKREVGKPLEVDGETVRDIVPAALDKGAALIRSVDAWLIGHPQKERKSKGD